MEVKAISKNLMMAAVVVTMLNFQSCGKYEDGPGFSLRTKKNRLKGEWEVVRVSGDNGNGGLSNYDIEMEFEKDGDFSLTSSYSYYGNTYTYTQNGEWEFSSNKEDLEIDFNDGSSNEWEIKRLTNKEFNFEDESGREWELEAK